MFSQPHSGAIGRKKIKTNSQRGASIRTYQGTTPSVFGRLTLQDYKDNCLPQILVLSERGRFLNLQEFRTTSQALYKFVARNNLRSKKTSS